MGEAVGKRAGAGVNAGIKLWAFWEFWTLTKSRAILKPALAILIAAGACGTVGGCGKKGPLDPPLSAKIEGEAKSAESADPGKNSAAPKKEHEGFVLDGLLR